MQIAEKVCNCFVKEYHRDHTSHYWPCRKRSPITPPGLGFECMIIAIYLNCDIVNV